MTKISEIIAQQLDDIADLVVTAEKDEHVVFLRHYEYNPNMSTGLTWGYYKGLIRSGETVTETPAGTVNLTDNATNYIEVDSNGVVSANTTGFTVGRIPLYEVVTVNGAVSSFTDKRSWISDGSGATTFTELTDGPGSYTGNAGKAVIVKSTEDGLEFGLAGGIIPARTDDPVNPAIGEVWLRTDLTELNTASWADFTINTLTDLAPTDAAVGAPYYVVSEAKHYYSNGSVWIEFSGGSGGTALSWTHTPAHGSSGNPVNVNLDTAFNKQFLKPSADGTEAKIYPTDTDRANNTNAISATVSFVDGYILRIDPVEDLPGNEDYYVRIFSGLQFADGSTLANNIDYSITVGTIVSVQAPIISLNDSSGTPQIGTDWAYLRVVTPASGATAYDVYVDGSLVIENRPDLTDLYITGLNTAVKTHSFYVVAKNEAGTTVQSNTVSGDLLQAVYAEEFMSSLNGYDTDLSNLTSLTWKAEGVTSNSGVASAVLQDSTNIWCLQKNLIPGNIPIDTSTNKYIELVYRGNRSFSVNTLSIYFTTTVSTEFSESKRIMTASNSGSANIWHRKVINMGTNADWNGTLMGLKVQPCYYSYPDTSTGFTIDTESIRICKVKP